MTPRCQELSSRYAPALLEYLKSGSMKSLSGAAVLGLEAVSLGIETYDLARLHQVTFVSIQSRNRSGLQMKRSAKFFEEANAAIEETHRAARESRAQLMLMKQALGRRTEELADSERQLKLGINRRKVVEAAFAKSNQQHKKCLQESLELQKRLRLLTHRVLAAQEGERKVISRELQDEIAQTLLGINVRLLSLKLEAHTNSTGLKREISKTQKWVSSSTRSVHRVVRGLGGK